MKEQVIWTAAALVLCAALPAKAGAGANRVTAIEVDGPRVVVHGTQKPDFSAFKLAQPARLVVDLAGADVTSAVAPAAVHKDGIAGVTVAQFDEGATKVGRIVVALESDSRYDVSAQGNDLVVVIGQPAAATEERASPATGGGRRPEHTAVPASDPNLVASREDVRDVSHPASRLQSVAVKGDGETRTVVLATDGEVARFDVVELRNPGRLALDLHAVSSSAAHKTPATGPLKGVRVAKHDDGVRVVLDAASDAMPKYQVVRGSKALTVKIGEALLQKAPAHADTKIAAATEPARDEASVPAKGELEPMRAAPANAVPALVRVRAVDLRTDGGKTRVMVDCDGAAQFEVTRPDANTAILGLRGADLPERLERNLDASSLKAPVTMLSSYRVPGKPGEVQIVATMRPGTTDAVEAAKGTIIWNFGGPQAAAQAQPAKAAPRAAPMTMQTRANSASAGVYDSSQYTGRRVDFNVKDIDIRNLLGAISEISKKNIIVADDVKGTVTIKLRNVPWDQALDIILKSKQLGKDEVGNIIRIAPIATLRAEQKEAADAAKASLSLQPLRVRLVPVNYANAKDMADRLKDTLTERGSVSVDVRTNTLIVKDVQEALLRAEGIVRNLDTQTPEVLIESRIVEAATSFSRQVGVQWGGNVSFAPTTGNPTGLVFPNIVQAAGAADDPAAPLGGLNGVTVPNFAVNMPAPIGINNGGGIGFVLGSAGGAAQLNLRLSAAENSGTIKTISSPRAVTLDNVQATIGQGVSIPYAQTSAAGVNTTFIEARLELAVTPHVTQEGSIQMSVRVTNNQPNPQLTGANGQPSISRREANTQVLVKDGDTTVIGGIYTRRNSEAFNEVPLLSKIPVLGWLFKKKAVTDDRTELLIFITPRIVNRSQSVVAAGQSDDSQKQ
ncbi:MAG: type IV pilus secretin PilQ [Deltaproteobacteria bacterium]|nr:MAG: type IV pilus secretin PilQ [Deltaproteobacteria bacterium]